MIDREKFIKGVECHRKKVQTKNASSCLRECPYSEPDPTRAWCISGLMDDICALLKEQEDEKKRIMKVIWDTLHEGLSIDTVADQDWVYERIRHQIEDT